MPLPKARLMPTKTKSTKAAKTPPKRVATKAKPASKKPAAPKSRAKPAVKKVPAKTAATKRKSPSLMQSVQKGVRSGIESVGDLVKKVTPDALLPKSAKSKRR